MNTAELLVKCLEAEGVEYIFGVPGEENAHFMIALEDSSIRFILTRHEQGAAFMADVYGRLTGKAGVCLGTLGPGASNLVTGVANGNMDRSPMVVLTGQADSKRQHKESHQHMDVVGMYEPLTKWSTSILHPDNVPEVVRKAFKLATTEKPGACLIELAEDIAELPATKEPTPHRPIRRPVPSSDAIDTACELICAAKRPVVLAGNGLIRQPGAEELRRFAKQTGIGVISTFMGKGAISRHEEECLFTIGLQAKDVVACAVDAADLVICIGYDLVEYPPRLWNGNGSKRIIHIDFQPAEVDDHYRLEVELIGDIGQALRMVNDRLCIEKLNLNISSQAAVRRDMLADFAEHKDDETAGAIRPQKVLWDVRQFLGPEDILLSDVGAHKMWVARYYHCETPNTCLIANGFCSMGFALPGAIAAQLVHPDRRVLAICGDGGFLMNCQEMETARRLQTPIVAMVWEDGGYGLISWKQDNEFHRHTDLSFSNPDWIGLAESFGWRGMRIEQSADLGQGLEEAFSENTPCLLAVPIDYRENALLTKRLGNIVCPI